VPGRFPGDGNAGDGRFAVVVDTGRGPVPGRFPGDGNAGDGRFAVVVDAGRGPVPGRFPVDGNEGDGGFTNVVGIGLPLVVGGTALVVGAGRGPTTGRLPGGDVAEGPTLLPGVIPPSNRPGSMPWEPLPGAGDGNLAETAIGGSG
jgi:hypothetical protein